MHVYDRNGPSSKPARVLLFSEFIELEFYFFRKYDPKPEFARTFDTFFNLLFKKELALKKPENLVERYHREIRVPNHRGPMVLHVK